MSDQEEKDDDKDDTASAKSDPPAKPKKKKKKKNKSDKGADKKLEAAKDERPKEEKAKVKEVAAEEADDDEPPKEERPKAKKPESAAAKVAHGDHAHGHEHAPDRKEYWRTFGILLVLTILEVGLAYTRGSLSKTALVTGLIGMALAKAACVAFFFMHLKHESKVMRWTVAFPIIFPALYAFILIAEGAYRAFWGA